MTYAAYGLFDQVSETATFSEELKQRIAMSIRQAVLFHTSPSDYATAVFGFEEPLQIINTGEKGFNIRFNSPTNEGTFEIIEDGVVINLRPNEINSSNYTASVNTQTIVLSITQIPYLDTQNVTSEWVFIGNSQGQYGWIRKDLLASYNIDWSLVDFASFEDLDPYRPFTSDHPFNPPLLQKP